MAENSPERWLQSQTSDLLETAILLLDRLHCPPFELGWLHSESGQTYRTLLLEVERVLLEVWEATQIKNSQNWRTRCNSGFRINFDRKTDCSGSTNDCTRHWRTGATLRNRNNRVCRVGSISSFTC